MNRTQREGRSNVTFADEEEVDFSSTMVKFPDGEPTVPLMANNGCTWYWCYSANCSLSICGAGSCYSACDASSWW